mgnify:CR=1 FL=1
MSCCVRNWARVFQALEYRHEGDLTVPHASSRKDRLFLLHYGSLSQADLTAKQSNCFGTFMK